MTASFLAKVQEIHVKVTSLFSLLRFLGRVAKNSAMQVKYSLKDIIKLFQQDLLENLVLLYQ